MQYQLLVVLEEAQRCESVLELAVGVFEKAEIMYIDLGQYYFVLEPKKVDC